MAKFGVVFPGQGSQYPGMGQDLYRGNQSVRELFATAGEVLDRDMVSLCFEGPQEALDLTANTQIAVLTADLAAWLAFSERMTTAPLILAGHSLGEYAALYAAGAVDLRDVLALVHLRGKFHQEAVPVGEGAMAAILGLPREAVEELCRGIDRQKHTVTLSTRSDVDRAWICTDLRNRSGLAAGGRDIAGDHDRGFLRICAVVHRRSGIEGKSISRPK